MTSHQQEAINRLREAVTWCDQAQVIAESMHSGPVRECLACLTAAMTRVAMALVTYIGRPQ